LDRIRYLSGTGFAPFSKRLPLGYPVTNQRFSLVNPLAVGYQDCTNLGSCIEINTPGEVEDVTVTQEVR